MNYIFFFQNEKSLGTIEVVGGDNMESVQGKQVAIKIFVDNFLN